MKGVFNRAALLLAVSIVTSGLAASGHAQVYYSVRGLLAEQFRQSDLVDFQRVQLSKDRRAGIERQLGQKLEKAEYIFYVAHSADHVDGYALFDRDPPFTTDQLEALVANDEFELIPWWDLFGIPSTPFDAAIRETYHDPHFSQYELDF